MAKWHETDNGVRTLQSIARNLETLTDQPSITPRDLFAAAALCGLVNAMFSTEVGIRAMGEWGADVTARIVEPASSIADAMMKDRDK